MSKIIITGATGFIGSDLVDFFSKKNSVFALAHTIPAIKKENVVFIGYELAGELDENIFIDADYLVHCAFKKNDVKKNIEGAKNLIMASRKFHLKKNIFISSFSAHANSLSKYGKQKFEIEKLFNTKNDCVVRAGVVLGNGGLFKQINEHIKRGKLIPLIDGGKQPIQTIYIGDLINIIEKIISENISGTFSVAEPVPVLYKDFFLAICENCNVKPKFISVSFFVLNLIISCAGFLKIPLPISRENALGLKKMRFIETKNDLEKFGIKTNSYKESLKILKNKF